MSRQNFRNFDYDKDFGFDMKTLSYRKQRKRVAIACVPCNKAKTSCDGG